MQLIDYYDARPPCVVMYLHSQAVYAVYRVSQRYGFPVPSPNAGVPLSWTPRKGLVG